MWLYTKNFIQYLQAKFTKIRLLFCKLIVQYKYGNSIITE